jgi:hypothetical protein
LKKRSQYDDVPEDLVHQPHVLNATAAELNQLIQLLLPESLAVLQRTATRETAISSAIALEAEARVALRALLDSTYDAGVDAEESEETEENIAWRHSLEQALSQEIHSSLSDPVPDWLKMRSCDLARTVATALIEFERSGMDKTSVLSSVITSVFNGKGEESWSLVGDLYRRFALSRPVTLCYLARVHSLLSALSVQEDEAQRSHLQLCER